MRGVFKTPRDDETSYLLCALIYAAGLRNSEIERLRPGDIVQIKDCYFIEVKQSKTENGKRPSLYEKIMSYATGRGYIFTKRGEAALLEKARETCAASAFLFASPPPPPPQNPIQTREACVQRVFIRRNRKTGARSKALYARITSNKQNPSRQVITSPARADAFPPPPPAFAPHLAD
ncbi:MAG: hypothetical protein Pg6C_03670 [Treponemataceae bacterium]|nr:MAG: hypothetical protein Pg6C_03670 [Treponemataceae bacterium]